MRLFRAQKGLPALEAVRDAKWTRAHKLGELDAMEQLLPFLEEFLPLLDETARAELDRPTDDLDDHIMAERVLASLATIAEMPSPDEALFHLIGDILHRLASMANRHAMWSLAYHLRVYAAHPDTSPNDEQTYTRTAELWETIGSWTRRQTPSWSARDGLLPASDRWLAPIDWLRKINAPLEMLVNNSRFTATIMHRENPTLPVAPENENGDQKTIPLLDRIGGLPDAEDESTAWIKTKPWRVLLDPMPVVGAFDPDQTYATLRREFPWMDAANRAIGEMVAGLANGRRRFAPLLIVGEPGIGKTAWALRVAELCALPKTLISLSTSASSMLIAGDEREWSGSGPCLAAKVARESKVANPLIILDELEKASSPSSSHATSAHEALLPMLDCDEKRTYYDLFLQGNLDLSRFSWLFLANSLTSISAPLLDRLTIIETRRPTIAEIDLRLDAMMAAWLPGQEIEAATKSLALAKFKETRSLRDVRAIVERASLQSLWQAPGPKPV